MKTEQEQRENELGAWRQAHLDKCYAVEIERTRRLKAANPEFVMAEVRKAIKGRGEEKAADMRMAQQMIQSGAHYDRARQLIARRKEEIDRGEDEIVMREEETLP